MTYKVILRAVFWDEREEIELEKSLELPFVPFPGLEIDLTEWSPEGDAADCLKARLMEAGVSPDENMPEDYVVRSVSWSPHARSFTCNPDFDDYYHKEMDEGCFVSDELAYWSAFGFLPTSRGSFTKNDEKGG